MVKSVVKDCTCDNEVPVFSIPTGTLFYGKTYADLILMKADDGGRAVVVFMGKSLLKPGSIVLYTQSDRRELVPKGTAIELCQE